MTVLKRISVIGFLALFLGGLLVSLSQADQKVLFPVNQQGKFGYIDQKGRVVIEPIYDWAFGFSEGLALVNISGSKNEYGFVMGASGVTLALTERWRSPRSMKTPRIFPRGWPW